MHSQNTAASHPFDQLSAKTAKRTSKASKAARTIATINNTETHAALLSSRACTIFPQWKAPGRGAANYNHIQKPRRRDGDA
jgi:hypothetical protein